MDSKPRLGKIGPQNGTQNKTPKRGPKLRLLDWQLLAETILGLVFGPQIDLVFGPDMVKWPLDLQNRSVKNSIGDTLDSQRS